MTLVVIDDAVDSDAALESAFIPGIIVRRRKDNDQVNEASGREGRQWQ